MPSERALSCRFEAALVDVLEGVRAIPPREHADAPTRHSSLVFMALGRPDSLGGGDLHISYHKDGEWTPAKSLGRKVNGPGLEIGP